MRYVYYKSIPGNQRMPKDINPHKYLVSLSYRPAPHFLSGVQLTSFQSNFT